MAARTQTYAAPRRSNLRATLALLLGIVAALAVPLAIEWTRHSGADTLKAAWAIPIAAGAAVVALILERGARRAGGSSRRLMAARVLAVAGICFAISAALAVGIYEFLLWKENH